VWVTATRIPGWDKNISHIPANKHNCPGPDGKHPTGAAAEEKKKKVQLDLFSQAFPTDDRLLAAVCARV
jgi:hypothetical protein